MGFLTDVLKEIPLSAVLKEKIASIEAKHAATETENAILKDDLHEAKAEITKLKKQIEELAHKDDLDENDRQVLVTILQLDKSAYSDLIARQLNLHQQRAAYHLEKLE